MDDFRPKANSRVVKLGRRYSLVLANGAYVVSDTRNPARPGERFPASDRAQALVRFHALEDRLGSRMVWVLERGLYPSGQTLAVSAAVIAGLIFLIGLLAVRDETGTPALLGGALTVEIGDNGVPYVAINPEALRQNEAEPITANGRGKGREVGSSPAQLPSDGDVSTFARDDPSPGTDPQPSPDPRPTPVPSPSPSPSPDPSPGPGPSPTPNPSPEPEPSLSPSPEPEPSPSPEPSSSPEPSVSPKPTKPPKPPKPSPSPEP